MRSFELRAALEKILRKLNVIDAKVSRMPLVQVQVSGRLLPSLQALVQLGGAASAGQVAAVTGRHRAVESGVLNELAREGLVVKEKRGRTKVFRLVKADEGKTVDC
jgi:hypothetical protein